MNPQNLREVVKQICDFMGEDLDAPPCKEVEDHLRMCPTCKVYFDTVKKTVTLCREHELHEKLPHEVSEKLYKVLNLDDIQKKFKK